MADFKTLLHEASELYESNQWFGVPKSRSQVFTHAIQITNLTQKIHNAPKQCFEIGHH